MSLFPIRLSPGGTITVHLRWQCNFPIWIHRKDWLIDPKGKRTLCYERMLPFLPATRKTLDEVEIIEKSGQIYAGAPLLMAARYLQNDVQSSGHFLDMLVGLRDDTHHYYTLTLPNDAPLGRYRFELEDRAFGKLWSSQTSDTDCFYVEKLVLTKVIEHGNSFVAFVENSSPEEVLGQLCQFHVESGDPTNQKLISFAPKSITEIPFTGAGILMYRDGDEIIRLTNHKQQSCVANPKFQMAVKGPSTLIFSTDAVEQSYELSGHAQRIWRLANGFIPKNIIRTTENAGIYDEMVQMGVIIEVE